MTSQMYPPRNCPVCWHSEIVMARRNKRQPIPERQKSTMRWRPPSGQPRGQQCTRWDAGTYECEACGCRLIPYDLDVLADATGSDGAEPNAKLSDGGSKTP